jgi:excisionase family DNA binding protein
MRGSETLGPPTGVVSIQNDKLLLRVNEFAERLDVTPACVRRWLLERKIVSTRIGRLVRIPASEVQRLIESGLRPARPAR